MPPKTVYATIENNMQVIANLNGFEYIMDSVAAGDEPTGVSPTDMLFVAMAGCKAMTAKTYATRAHLDVRDIKVRVEGEVRKGEGGVMILDMHTVIDVDGDISPEEYTRMSDFIEKRCHVHKILSQANTVTQEVNLVNQD